MQIYFSHLTELFLNNLELLIGSFLNLVLRVFLPQLFQVFTFLFLALTFFLQLSELLFMSKFRIGRALVKSVEVFLCVTPDLGARSRAYVLLNLSPVLAEEGKTFNKLEVFLGSPTPLELHA